MSELPTSWAWAPLAAVTSDAVQKEPAAEEQFFYIDIGSVDRNTKQISWPQALVGNDAPSRARKLIRAGDTLVSMTRPILNAVALVPEHLDGQIASTGFDVLRPCGVDPRWLIYLVRTQAFIDEMSSLVQGALYPAVRSKDVRGYMVPVAPSNEQKRIADQLDAMLARVNACNDRFDGIPAILKRFRRAVLSDAVAGGPSADSTSSLEQVNLPDGIGMTKIVDALAEPLRNGKSVRDGDGLRVLRLTALQPNGVDLRENKQGDWKEVRDTARFLVHDGDYLVSRGNGSKDLVGRGALVFGCNKPIAFPDTMIRFRPSPSRLLPKYLKYVWDSEGVRLQIRRAAKTTAGIWKISQTDLECIQVPLPSIDEQAKIVRRVESLFAIADRLEARCATARAQVARLTQLLLAKAFRGELVPQDPADEPASELLARLCQRRADNSAGSSKRRGAKPGHASVARTASSA